MPVISSVFEAGTADMSRRNSEIKKEWLTKEVSKKEANAKRHMNTEFLEEMTPSLLFEIDVNDEVKTWLKTINEALQDSNG